MEIDRAGHLISSTVLSCTRYHTQISLSQSEELYSVYGSLVLASAREERLGDLRTAWVRGASRCIARLEEECLSSAELPLKPLPIPPSQDHKQKQKLQLPECTVCS